MKIYFAPMEGITTYIYRNAFEHYYKGVDSYFTPFIVNKKLSAKEIRDICPENNQNMKVIPQIMTNKAEDFLSIAKELAEYGYHEVNLNLGCPSGTVVAKKRGAGFLAYPEELDLFLAEIFEKAECQISIKTRIGVDEPEEWDRLLQIYEKYPLKELIIHPRIQKDFYKYPVRMEAYEKAYEKDMQLCYNGDIDTLEKQQLFQEKYEETDAIMLGRGLLKNPDLAKQIRGEKTASKEILRAFHDEIYEGYRGIMSGDRNTLYKMKELWFYMSQSFTNPEKYMKKIKKTEHLKEYEIIVDALFREQE